MEMPSTTRTSQIGAGDVLDAGHGGSQAQFAAYGNRSGKANLVAAVVDAHGDALHHQDLSQEHRREGERQVAVGDGGAERAALRPLGIHVDPLVVAGGVGEQVDLVLVDAMPLAVAQMLPDQIPERIDALHGGCHGPDCTGSGSRDTTRSGRTVSDRAGWEGPLRAHQGPPPGRGGSGTSTRIPRRSHEGSLPPVVSVPSSMSGRY